MKTFKSRVSNAHSFLVCIAFMFASGEKVEVSYMQSKDNLLQCPPISICTVCQFKSARLDLVCNSLNNNHSKILLPLFEEVANLTLNLTFQDSQLQHLPEGICLLKNLENLDISRNQLEWYTLEKVACFKNLTILKADENEIENIEPGLFEHIRQLHTISLQYNKITEFDSYKLLKPLKKLRRLYLSHNELREVDIGALKLPSVLNSNLLDNVFYNVSFNKIERVTNNYNFHLKDLPVKEKVGLIVDFRKNQLRYLRNFDFLKLFYSDRWVDYLRLWDCGFYVMDNPYDCDCDLYNFLYPLRGIIYLFVNLDDKSFLDVKCASPPEASDKLIVDVFNSSVQDFRCYINKSCDNGFTCEYRPGIQTMIVTINNQSYANEMPKSVPRATNIELRLSRSPIKHLKKHGYLKNVTLLDMSNSELNVIDPKVIENLAGAKKMYFHNSKLKSVPSIIGKLENVSWEVLTLADNPFLCDCHLGGLKQFLLHSTIVPDYMNIKCSDPRLRGVSIIEVPNYKFACNYNGSSYSLVRNIIFYGIASGSLALFIATVIVYKNFSYIQLKYLKAYNKKLLFGRPKKTTKKKYDICFLYLDTDQDILENIVEITANYKSFYHRRDQTFGRNSREEMLEAMESCHCIMPVISEASFINPEFGILFQNCFRLFMEYEDKVLIPVLLSPVKKLVTTPGLDREMKYFLDLSCLTYIEYSSPDFENKLVQELQERGIKRRAVGNTARATVQEEECGGFYQGAARFPKQYSEGANSRQPLIEVQT